MQNENNMPTFYTAQEVAEVYFCGKFKYRRILEMTKSSMLPAMKEGKGYIYSKAALDAWTLRYMSRSIQN